MNIISGGPLRAKIQSPRVEVCAMKLFNLKAQSPSCEEFKISPPTMISIMTLIIFADGSKLLQILLDGFPFDS